MIFLLLLEMYINQVIANKFTVHITVYLKSIVFKMVEKESNLNVIYHDNILNR